MTVTERWVRVYTAGLPEEPRQRRREEIAADVHEQLLETGRAQRQVVGRTVRGAVDDLVWRREVARGMERTSMRAAMTQAWWAPAAALVLLFDIGFAVFILADDGSTMPGRVVGPAVVLATAAAMAIGLSVRVAGAGTRPARRLPYAALPIALVAALAAATIGGPVVVAVAAVVVIAAAALLARSTVRSPAVADTLILVGTLPALAMFWFVVPALLALTVIVGVLTSRTRTAVAPA